MSGQTLQALFDSCVRALLGNHAMPRGSSHQANVMIENFNDLRHIIHPSLWFREIEALALANDLDTIKLKNIFESSVRPGMPVSSPSDGLNRP